VIEQTETSQDKKNSGLLLAILLPIIILAVIGGVALISKVYFVPKGDHVPLAEDVL
jgi:hypothetical protein